MKLALLLVGILPSVMTGTFDARAEEILEARANIGQVYKVRASVWFSARCSGCGENSIGPIDGAILTLALTPDAGGGEKDYRIMISANEKFVSPVSGIVRLVDAKPPEKIEREYKDKCSDPIPTRKTFSLQQE